MSKANKRLVNNDFRQPRAIFELFDGLAVKDINVPAKSGQNGQANGVHGESNGNSSINENGAVAVA